MSTVIGLFDSKNEAKLVYQALREAGFAKADLDILTNDDKDDEPKLANLRSWVPEPDATIYLEGVADGGTVITANVADSQTARAAEIMAAYNMVNIVDRSAQLRVQHTDLPNLREDGVIEVIEEDLEVGKAAVERGRMRIYNVVTERAVEANVGLKDETIRVTRRPVNRAVAINDDLFKSRTYEMVEIDEVAQVAKTARVVEEVYLGKDVLEKTETIKDTLRRQDVEIEEVKFAKAYDEYYSDFYRWYNDNLLNKGLTYEDVTPGMKFGYNLATTEPFRSSNWSTIENDAMALWEEKNPGTWDANKGVVKYAWEWVKENR
jgi:uncharacterized protein (TIGR02271 family)